jgi:hypothetical protein
MLVKFLINPTGQFNLSYNLGEVVDIETKQAELLLEAKAVEVVAVPKVAKKKPTNPETELDAE